MIRKLQEKLHEGHFRPLDAECARMSTIHSRFKVLKTLIVGFVRRINLLSKDVISVLKQHGKRLGILFVSLSDHKDLIVIYYFSRFSETANMSNFTEVYCL